MTSHRRLTHGCVVACAALWFSPSAALAQSLGAAQDFAIVAGSAITAAVGSVPSQVVGDVGLSPGTSITGFPPELGAVVVPPYVLHTPNDGPSTAAQAAVTALWSALATTGGAATPIPDQLAGENYGPGTYSLGAANLASGGILRLTGNGTYIFRVSSSLTTISTSNVLLIGAQACNVWWRVGSSATIGGTTFAGNVVALTGTNSLGPNARLDGRMLATTPGAVTLAGNNTINAAFCAVIPPPGPVGVTKAFSPAVNGPGGISTLTITLTNQNATAATLTAALIDTLPAGVVISPSPNASTTCAGGVVTAAAGGNTVTLSAGAIIPGGAPGSCTIIVNVIGAVAGTYTNTIPIGGLQTSNGNNTVPAIAVLTITPAVPPAPTLSEWAMIGLAGLLCLSGMLAIRRRQTVARPRA
jgi:hypothetical protein